MKNYVKIFVTIVIIAFTQSCSDYVDETNPNEVSADAYFQNLGESQTVLTSVYGAMLNSWITSPKEEAWRSDMAFPGIREGRISVNALNYYQHIILENDNSLNLRWNALYQVIWRSNQVIDGLNSMSEDLKSQTEWRNQMGQARFFRGLAHFYLHSLFNEGRIVIRDAIPGSQEEFSKPLSTSQEVMDFFRADLLYAYENLPAQFPQKTKATAGAAATILGTSYLYSASDNPADYQIAKTYFEDVINGPYGYALVQDANIMFKAAGDFNSESILEINYSNSQQPEDNNFDEESFFTRNARYSAPFAVGGGNTNEQFTASSWLIHAFATEPLDLSDPRNLVIDRGTNALRPRKVSLRASAMIAMVNDEDTEYYGQPSAAIAVNFSSIGERKYGFFKKYTNHDIIDNENNLGDNNWKSGKNIILNRLADVHLMYAEALLLGDNNISAAITNINFVRERWGLELLDENASLVDGTPYTPNSLMEHLMYVERPLELAVEGVSIRVIDLRRWGIASDRFNELATRDYYLVDYNYFDDATGTIQTRENSLVRFGVSPDPTVDPQIIKEYVRTAQLYTNGYLPIPTSETLNNNAVTN
ncbi:RagB/SusD family nutrient uptake outer membrane protein [uncultured Polaribacter sp.]|uniref:RagB/SusD family nutrient uptake outer membrane protein n=1 Tax=uncultured Polaribacter sp. TaxID=174711 RepID=UPI002636AEA5|nr:RagB/SusD family nutrient uptake outer membrane protein [uncultured Polaribacter sp.]